MVSVESLAAMVKYTLAVISVDGVILQWVVLCPLILLSYRGWLSCSRKSPNLREEFRLRAMA